MRRAARTSAVLAATALAVGAGLTPASATVDGPGAVHWARCPDASGPHPAQCTDLRVPLDWSRPGGRTISIHVSRLPALDPAHRIGPLLFNPGGPGGAGAETVSEAGRTAFSPDLQRRFDIVGFDPRGVGLSTAVHCTGPALAASVPVFPRSGKDFAAIVAQSAHYARGCAARSTPGLLEHVDSRSVARDIDAIRVALGAPRISWLGVSYGTYLGQAYARLFPHRVRTMVLDGAIDHAVGARGWLWRESSSLADVFGRFARWCHDSTACALHGRDVRAVWDRLLARAPLPAPHAQAGPTTVSRDAVEMVLPTLLYFGPTSPIASWPELGRAIAEAAAGDASRLADNTAVGTPQPAYAAVSCHDFPPQFVGPQHGYPDAAARLAVARAISPHTDGASEAWEMSDLCAGWPVRPADPWGPEPVTGAPPILVASARHDPATPLALAQGMHREIAGSGLLIAEVTGHTAFFNSACARAAESDYLLSGRLPARSTCGSSTGSAERRTVPEDGAQWTDVSPRTTLGSVHDPLRD